MPSVEISLLIPVLNGMPFIQKCLESIWAQKMTSFEVVVWDGGSTDGTWEYLNSLADPRLKLYQGPDAGPGDAMNRAFHLSSGKIITIPLADTYYLHQEVLGQILEIFGDPSVEMVYADMDIVDQHSEELQKKYPANRGKLFLYPSIHLPTSFFTRALLEKFPINTAFKYLDDYDLMMRLHLAPVMMFHFPQTILNFRSGGRSQTVDRFVYRQEMTQVKFIHLGPLKTLSIDWANPQNSWKAKLYTVFLAAKFLLLRKKCATA